MKRRILATLMAMLCLFMCSQPAAATKIDLPPSLDISNVTKENLSQDVTLKLDQKNYSRFELTVVATFKNTTKNAYGFGFDFALEQQINGIWYQLPKRGDTPMLGLYLGPKTKLNQELLLTDSTGAYGAYGVLGFGLYRIAWPIKNEDTHQISYLTAEFTITPDTVLYALEPVNLRKGPSAESETIRELSLGEQVTLIHKTGKWSKVISGKQIGYVYTEYLAASDAAAYYNHWAVKSFGKSKIKSITRMKDAELKKLRFGFDYIRNYHGGKDIGKYFTPVSAEKSFIVTFKKPFNEFELYFFCYGSPEAAKSQADIIKQQAAISDIVPDQQLKMFWLDHTMLIAFSGQHPIGSYTKTQDAFCDQIEQLLDKECDYITFSNFM